MFFLLRVAFWLTIVLILLPTGRPEPQRKAAQFDAIDAVSAAATAVADMSHFCDRQPEACVAGSQAAVALGHRAQAGAKMLYEFLNERLGPSETGSVAASPSAKPVPAGARGLQHFGSQHTLTPADREPAWRGPPPRKDHNGRRPA
jgi:hypothetical protein